MKPLDDLHVWLYLQLAQMKWRKEGREDLAKDTIELIMDCARFPDRDRHEWAEAVMAPLFTEATLEDKRAAILTVRGLL